MPNETLGLVTHPLPVAAHILGQALRTVIAPVHVMSGMHRGLSGEFRWNLDQRFGDQHCNRV